MRKYPKVIDSMETAKFVFENFPREYWEKDFEELLAEDIEIQVYGKYESDIVVPVSREEADDVLANRDQWEDPKNVIYPRQSSKTIRERVIIYNNTAYSILLPDLENTQTYAAKYGISEDFITAALVMGVTPDLMDDYLNGQGLLGGNTDESESGTVGGTGDESSRIYDGSGKSTDIDRRECSSTIGTENDQVDDRKIHGETLE